MFRYFTGALLGSARCLTFAASIVVLPAVADARTLTVAHTGSPGNSVYVYFDTFARELKAISNGKLDTKVHPAGQLGGDDQLLQSVKLGTVDVTSVATANMGALTNAFFWTDLPYMFKSRESAEKVFATKDIVDPLADKVAKEVGTRVLDYIQVGGFRMLQNTKRPLVRPGDAAGLKFRSTPSPIDVALIKAWGGLPTPVAWAETYTAVQQGVVDGLNLQPSWTALGGFGQVIRHATLNQAVMAFHVVQANQSLWQSLSAEEKGWITQAAAKARAAANEADAKAESDFLAKLESQGVKLHRSTPDEIAEWRSKAASVEAEVAARLDKALVEKVRATQAN